jgi:D-galactose 1-dehydrogenase/L-arabinose 1- dehydrogenase
MVAIALVGLGKIARDQHIPSIAAHSDLELVATVSPNNRLDDLPAFTDLAALKDSGIAVDAVAICTPPSIRHALALEAIAAGWHVFLEKPPAATLSAAKDLVERAAARGVTLFASWHSRAAAGVAPAGEWLAGKAIRSALVEWREDIRHWHPGQEWILGAGGFGVFDPGINGLSILTEILPDPVVLTSARIGVPDGRASPLTASMTMQSGGAPVSAEFDFLKTGEQTWSITVETDAGTLRLDMGGRLLSINGAAPVDAEDAEYPALYRRFAELIARGESDVDLAPLRLVADAFLVAERDRLPAFAF